MSEQQTLRLFSKAAQNYSVTVRFEEVVMAPSDPWDPYQHWIKDTKYGNQVKDKDGNPGFALINKATGEAIQHPTETRQPVKLVPYNPDVLDKSVIWTEGGDEGGDFRPIRKVTDTGLNLDARRGTDKYGGVRDGTVLLLFEWNQGKNQLWKMTPYDSAVVKTRDVVNKIFTRSDADYSLTIKDGKVEMAPTNAWDENQYWIKDTRYGGDVKDPYGFPSFALVNKATGQALKHSELGQPVQLVKHNPDKMDRSFLWTHGRELEDGYRAIRKVSNVDWSLDAKGSEEKVNDGTPVILHSWLGKNNQKWKILPNYSIRG